MAVLRLCSAFLCLTFPAELSSSLEFFFFEEPSRSTRRLLTGASSLSSCSRTVKSGVLSVLTPYGGE